MSRDRIIDPQHDPTLEAVHAGSNRRKRDLYWIGFLQGARASGRIEHAERAALEAEARQFAEFLGDADALDLADDIAAACFSNPAELEDHLSAIVQEKKAQLTSDGSRPADTVNEFLGLCAGIVADGVVTQPEADAMLPWLEHPAIAADPCFVKLRAELQRVLADGYLNDEEAEDLRAWIGRLVGDGYALTGLASFGLAAQDDGMIQDANAVVLPERTFVLTGALRLAPRQEVIRLVENAGGRVARSVSRRVHYVVVSLEASRHWKQTHYGTKLEAARALIAKGTGPELVAEGAFEQALVKRA